MTAQLNNMANTGTHSANTIGKPQITFITSPLTLYKSTFQAKCVASYLADSVQ